jgi:hypothetical protein
MKVWVLLGEMTESLTGRDVIAVFRRDPTKRQQQEALKRYIFGSYDEEEELEEEDIEDEVLSYEPQNGGSLEVVRCEVEPRKRVR